jgi:hypothetical protein
MSTDLPWYFAVNDRPVKVVPTDDGGADVLVLDLCTGGFVRNLDYLGYYFEGGRDVDELSEAEFNALVEKHNKRLQDQ